MILAASGKVKQATRNLGNQFSAQINAITDISSSLKSTISAINRLESSTINTYKSIGEIMSGIDGVSKSTRKQITAFNNLVNVTDEGSKDIKRSTGLLSKSLKSLVSGFGKLLNAVTDTANRYSQLSNTMISVSGATGAAVRASRSEIVQDIVGQLNKETGYYFNGEKSYERMIDIANAAGIGNLEAIKELSRPILLAAESMNLNNTELSKVFNKFYTRYNFSSRQMENMVDEIRGNTAGNNATAEATLENISKFQNIIGFYAKDNESREKMMSAISSDTSRMEAMGINSGYVYNMMYKIAAGDLSEAHTTLSLLNKGGYSGDWRQANYDILNGNMSVISDALIEGLSSYASIGDPSVRAEALSKYGIDFEEALNTAGGSSGLLSNEEFKDSTKNTQTAVEAIGDKFVDASTKMNNYLSQLSERVAKIQEYLPFSAGELLSVLGSILTAVSLSNLGGTGGSSKGGFLGKIGGKIGGKLKGAIGKIGVGGAAGIAAGGVLAVDGIKGIFDEDSDNVSKSLSGVQAGLGIGGAAAIAAGSGPVGWAAIAAGGLVFLGKKAYENATELSGNAKKISSEINEIGDGLKKESMSRWKKIVNLEGEFNRETDISQKRQLMEESGLFKKEELEGKSISQLEAMIESYKKSSESINEVTNRIVKSADKVATKSQNDQQKNLVSKLSLSGQGLGGYDQLSNEQMLQVLDIILSDENLDNKLRKKIEKHKKNGKINIYEWMDIINGGKNSWFDKNNIEDKSLNIDTMNLISDYLGWGANYHSSDKVKEAMAPTQTLYAAYMDMDKDKFLSTLQSIEEQGLMNEADQLFKESTGMTISAARQHRGYRVGSNYIDSDQVAVLHEGESVVPKRYNPAANITELEMLREYYKNSSNQEASEDRAALSELRGAISEIKSFLEYWRDDNIRRDTARDRRASMSNSANFVSSYMTTF